MNEEQYSEDSRDAAERKALVNLLRRQYLQKMYDEQKNPLRSQDEQLKLIPIPPGTQAPAIRGLNAPEPMPVNKEPWKWG